MCTWIYFTYIYIHTVHIHTHARAHTHGWCRPLQSHGAINSQIYKINRFSSNRSLLDVEVTHENKTDSNPDPADWTWAPHCSQQRPGAGPSILQGPAGGWQSPLETFSFVFGCRNFLQTIPSLLLQALGECMAAALLDTGGMSLPSFANANLTEAIPREGGGGDNKLKLLSLIQFDQRSGVFSTKKGPSHFFFPCLWSSYYIF